MDLDIREFENFCEYFCFLQIWQTIFQWKWSGTMRKFGFNDILDTRMSVLFVFSLLSFYYILCLLWKMSNSFPQFTTFGA